MLRSAAASGDHNRRETPLFAADLDRIALVYSRPSGPRGWRLTGLVTVCDGARIKADADPLKQCVSGFSMPTSSESTYKTRPAPRLFGGKRHQITVVNFIWLS
jgi:hypothetical protein